MEVHHHPHVEKKTFKEYLLEGLMIFVAVTMGFIAENIRESIENHETEKRSIEIVLNNLRSDTTRLSASIEKNKKKIEVLDKVSSYNVSHPLSKDSIQQLISLIYQCGPFYDFISNDAAIEQMKSSGSIRLIHKKGVLDSILHYEYINKLISNNQAACQQWNYDAHINHTKLDKSVLGFAVSSASDLSSMSAGNLYLKQQKALALQCFEEFAVVRYILSTETVPLLEQQLNNGSRLIHLLEKEYDLEKE